MAECIRYINLPKPPSSILEDFKQTSDMFPDFNDAFLKTKEYCELIDEWCKINICDSLKFGVQVIKHDVSKHKDNGNLYIPQSKLVYLVESGGKDVITKFWFDNDKLFREYKIKTKCWHLIKVNTLHSVHGIEPNKIRWGISAQMFHIVE